MRSQGFGTRGSIGNIEPVGTVKTYGPAALESVQGMNLMSNMPDGWLRPNFQVLSKAQHIDLADCIAAVETYAGSIVTSLAGTFGEAYQRFQNTMLVGNGVGIRRSADGGLTFATTVGVRCSVIRRVKASEWVANDINAATGLAYQCSNNDGGSFTRVEVVAGGSPIRCFGFEFDGTHYYAFRPDGTYYKGTGLGTINTPIVAPWSACFDMHRVNGLWVAVLTLGGQTGVFTSADLITWVLRKSIPLTKCTVAETMLQVVGSRVFAFDAGSGTTAVHISTDGGVTWTSATSIDGGQLGYCFFGDNSGAPSWVGEDGVRLMSSLCVSDDGGLTWRRWIQNPAGVTHNRTNAIDCLTPGSFLTLDADNSGRFIARTRLFDPATHFQIPGSASFNSIPFPIMRVR